MNEQNCRIRLAELGSCVVEFKAIATTPSINGVRLNVNGSRRLELLGEGSGRVGVVVLDRVAGRIGVLSRRVDVHLRWSCLHAQSLGTRKV